MTREERMLSNHLSSLTGVFGENYKSLKFEPPAHPDNDTYISNSPTKKIAYITRHLLTSEVTHGLILEKETYNRI